MATNTNLTIDMITKEALAVLHQELNIIPEVRRDFDNSYARTGAKIGDTLRIRKPVRYDVGTGATITPQDSVEEQVSLAVATQKHVAMEFSAAEMSLDIDMFSQRYIRPAMARLAAQMESDFLGYMKNRIFNTVGDPAAAFSTLGTALLAREKIMNGLPPDGDLKLRLNLRSSANLVGGVSTLFNSQQELDKQYKQGYIGRIAGFSVAENTLLPSHTNGARGAGPVEIAGGGQTGATLNIDGLTASTGQVKAGDVFTIENVFSVHPETKVSTGQLQQFVVTADSTPGATATIAISPAIVTSGPRQNVSAGPADNADLVFVGATAASYGNNFAFHKDAFAFATAPLELPAGGVISASRAEQDGLSLRAIQDYAIGTDQFITRVDVLYGFTELYPQLAAKIVNGLAA
jgi:hypothetical protein